MWGPFVQLLTYLPCQPCYKGLVAPVTYNKLGAWPLSTYLDKASPATSETVSIDLSHLNGNLSHLPKSLHFTAEAQNP